MTSLQCFDRIFRSQENISWCFALAETCSGGRRSSSAGSAGSALLSPGATDGVGASVARPLPPRLRPTALSLFLPGLTTLSWRCLGPPLPFFCPPWPPTPFARAGRLLLLDDGDASSCPSAVAADGEAFAAAGDGGGRSSGTAGLVVVCAEGTGGYILSHCRLSRIRCEDMQAIRRRTTACRCRVLQCTLRA